MSLDGKILQIAADRYRKNKTRREDAAQRRLHHAYQEMPRLREIDRALRETMLATLERALRHGGDPEAELRVIEAQNLKLQAERAALLKQNGYAPEDMDETPACALCDDTGYVNGAPCSCLMDIYRTVQREELSSLLMLGEETFDTFQLDYYDDTVRDAATGETARQNMAYNYELCLHYARRFGPQSPNLFLNGGTGLGKTFLSTCIAKTVSEKGFSVVYDTATSIFSKFEAEKFSRRAEEDPDETQRYLSCDLLILDDLGTEMTTSFTVSALYTLINTRLTAGKKTVVSSNYSLQDLRQKYSPQIMSRLEGEYDILTFYGSDIRILKKSSEK